MAYNFYICCSHACSLRLSSTWTLNLRRLSQRKGKGSLGCCSRKELAGVSSLHLLHNQLTTFTLVLHLECWALLHLSSYFHNFVLSTKTCMQLEIHGPCPHVTHFMMVLLTPGCTQLLMHIDMQVGLLCVGYVYSRVCISNFGASYHIVLACTSSPPFFLCAYSPPPVQLFQALM